MTFCGKRKRGISLIELLDAMTSVGVAISVSAGFLHTGMRMQSASRQDLEQDRSAMRLARQFREDIWNSISNEGIIDEVHMRTSQAGTQAVSLVQIQHAKGLVEYQSTPKGIVRIYKKKDGRTSREGFVLASITQWSVLKEKRYAVLRGCAAPQHKPTAYRAPRRVQDLEVVACIPSINHSFQTTGSQKGS